MVKLGKNDCDMLWGGDSPYSEAKLVLNTRILDDAISRVMVEVVGHINPTTFRLAKRHRKEFIHDMHIQRMLDTADYWGKKDGYVVTMGEEEYSDDPLVMKRAEEKLCVLKEALIRMHEFAMEHLEL